MKITIVGTGYVGLPLAVLLAQKHEVWAYDIDKTKINLISQRISPIHDKELEEYLSTKQLNLQTTTDANKAFHNASFIIIATPTNYDDAKNHFDTSSVDSTIETILNNHQAPTIIIKSTVPLGYCISTRKKYNYQDIIFSPEFLREGKALHDNLYPSRIIVGDKTSTAKEFANLLLDVSLNKETPILFTNPTEAEAIKLFANTYLAMRIAYFNELDTYAELKNINTNDIIKGVCLDPRIGNHYNNPSFGYGGYCLPKDTKQLLSNYSGVPQNIISAIIKANASRKAHIVNMILSKNPSSIGIYRLTMKSGSDNFRSSAILDIIKDLQEKTNIPIYIYEPSITEPTFQDIPLINDLADFKKKSSLIVANRITADLFDVSQKVYTRDIYGRD